MFLEKSKGVPVQSIWTDIKSLRLAVIVSVTGYPTQKPLALFAAYNRGIVETGRRGFSSFLRVRNYR